MTGRDLDIAIARIVGWGHVLDPLDTKTGQDLPAELTDHWMSGIPHYSTSIADAWTLEAEIARRNLQQHYVEALSTMIESDSYIGHIFLMVTAPAEARARAFLAAMRVDREG